MNKMLYKMLMALGIIAAQILFSSIGDKERGQISMNAEILDKIMQLLGEITKSVAVMVIAAKISEATTDDERLYLSQALAFTVQGEAMSGYHHQSDEGPPGFPHHQQFP